MNIKTEIENKIKHFLESRIEIGFAYIFGSFVKNENYHDIDIAVYLNKNFDKNDLIRFPYGYESFMISELTFLVKKKVDFIVMNNAEITLQQRIINKGTLLFSKDDHIRISYENFIRKLYIDSENIRRIKRKYLNKKIINA
jgi:predicted nucleotidyltransferase